MKQFVTVVILEHPEFAGLSSVIEERNFNTMDAARKHSSNLLRVYRGEQYTFVSKEAPFVLDDYISMLVLEREEEARW